MQLESIIVVCILLVSGILASQGSESLSGVILAKSKKPSKFKRAPSKSKKALSRSKKAPSRSKKVPKSKNTSAKPEQSDSAQEGPSTGGEEQESARPIVVDFLDAVIDDNLECVQAWLPQVQDAPKMEWDSQEYKAVKEHLTERGITGFISNVPIKMAIRAAILRNRLGAIELLMGIPKGRAYLLQAVRDASEVGHVEILKYLLSLSDTPRCIDWVLDNYRGSKKDMVDQAVAAVPLNVKIAWAAESVLQVEEEYWLEFVSHLTYDQISSIHTQWLSWLRERGDSRRNRTYHERAAVIIEKALQAAKPKMAFSGVIVTKPKVLSARQKQDGPGADKEQQEAVGLTVMNFLDDVIGSNAGCVQAWLPQVQGIPKLAWDSQEFRAIKRHLVNNGIKGFISNVPIKMAIRVAILRNRLGAIKVLMGTPQGKEYFMQAVKDASEMGHGKILGHLLSLIDAPERISKIFDYYCCSRRDMIGQIMVAIAPSVKIAWAVENVFFFPEKHWLGFVYYLTYDQISSIRNQWLEKLKGEDPEDDCPLTKRAEAMIEAALKKARLMESSKLAES